MKKTAAKIAVLALALLVLAGCGARQQTADSGQYPEFEFTHYTSGGTTETYTAAILFEESNATFTCYQVAFLSCTCRDSLVNYYMICYVELLNNKTTPEEAAIRAITFGDNRGLWGDSNPNHFRSDYTQEYMDENFVQRLVGAVKADFDAWQGYGTQIEQVEVDAVAGASVSTGNITSMLISLFEYHAGKYYGEA